MALPRDARLFLLSSVVGSFAGSFHGLYFNLYLKDLGYGQDWIGLLTAISSLVVVATALPLGLSAGAMGYKRLLLGGMGLQAAGMALPALLPRPGWLVAAAAVGGLGGAMGAVVGGPLLAELAEGGARARLFGLQAGASVLAGMAGSALAGVLPRLYAALGGLPAQGPEAYRAALLTGFFLYLCAFIPLVGLHGGRNSPALSLRALRGYRRFAGRLALINVLIGLGAGLILPFVNLFFRLRFALPDPLLGLVFALNSLLIGVGNLASPLLARRFGRIRVVVACQALSLPFFFLWGYVPVASLAILGYLVRTSLMNLAGPMFSVAVMEAVPPELRSGASAVNTVCWQGGWALGSLISGFVQVRWGFAPLFPATVLLYAVAIGLTWRSFGEAP
ncbi:MAG: MFS transporter [Candidatus Bipolaricaulota bacterium]|nr:MFS transporter [Candidatus Bipolaricaulota bacterium]MDW8151423.1 MFS transporter [Candidatus Bipolaricaulota bacterium]